MLNLNKLLEPTDPQGCEDPLEIAIKYLIMNT